MGSQARSTAVRRAHATWGLLALKGSTYAITVDLTRRPSIGCWGIPAHTAAHVECVRHACPVTLSATGALARVLGGAHQLVGRLSHHLREFRKQRHSIGSPVVVYWKPAHAALECAEHVPDRSLSLSGGPLTSFEIQKAEGIGSPVVFVEVSTLLQSKDEKKRN